LPTSPVATGSGKTGDGRDLVVVEGEVQDVLKVVEHERAPDALALHEREAERVLSEADHSVVERPSTATAKLQAGFGVRVFSFKDVVTPGSSEKRFSGATSRELGAQLLPALPLGTLTLKRGQPTIQLVSVGSAERQGLVLEAVPELADQFEPLVDREAADLLAGELHSAHGSQQS
jgi:hypothetical protein